MGPRASLACCDMATVIMHAVVSVDGFIAGENDDIGPLFEWYFNGDMPIADKASEERHAAFRVERAIARVRQLLLGQHRGHDPGAAPV